MKHVMMVGLLLCLLLQTTAQFKHYDFLGAGHIEGVSVSTSSNATVSGDKSVDGFPIQNKDQLIDASRFLAQATMGYDYESIQMAAAMGYEAWLEEQFGLPVNALVETVRSTDTGLFGEDDEFGFNMYSFRTFWMDTNLKNPEVLRQKMNYIFSQLFVVSAFGSDLFEDVGLLSAAYYDILKKHTFGNYRDLLSDISLSPSMGLYLSHYENPKSDPVKNIHPDENYAREIMQLFSIGLYELNNDGTQKRDANDRPIPTYDNSDIKEFAKIFTGFGSGLPDDEFGIHDEVGDMAQFAMTPMRMFEEWHEPGEKRLLNGKVVPAGQTGIQDFNDAIDNLYNHPNTAPFISRALIQFLVHSNPSPAYIDRVATVFNDNGQGVRGDMKAVTKAILLDKEARTCNPNQNLIGGKLREPLMRYTNMLKAFNPVSDSEFFFTYFERWGGNTGQIPMYSPTVFNFYLPDFQPNGLLANEGLFGPVFQIHNSSTSIGYVNEVNNWLNYAEPLEEGITFYDFRDEEQLADNPTALVDRLNVLLACGQLSEQTQTIITTAISQIEETEDRINMAIYLVMIAPEYAVLR